MAAYTPVTWSSAEEIGTGGLMGWIAAHVSFCKPVCSAWEGTIALLRNHLVLEGINNDTRAPIELQFRSEDVLDVSYGFDDTYKAHGDGLSWKPLRLTVTMRNGDTKEFYLAIDFKRGSGPTQNEEWFSKLAAWRQTGTAQ